MSVERLRQLNTDELAAAFDRQYVESDDAERLSLLERALRHPAVTVETYPGEAPPQELHVYLRASEVSDAPIFACVLASPEVVHELARQPPFVVMETASFQAMDAEVTSASITAAIEAWIRRVWPGLRVPTLRLSPWPGPIETEEGALEFLRVFPSVMASTGDLTTATGAFSPPSDLVPPEFLHERAA